MITRYTPSTDLQYLNYDIENRLTSITDAFQVPLVEFVYDGDGGRVKKITPDATTTYIGSLYEIQDTNNEIRITKHIFKGSTRLASKTNDDIIYYHGDHLGSSNLLTDSDGFQVKRLEYTPFGTTYLEEGEVNTNYRYTGKELDSSTGLYYYGARYYDTRLGRFITADPIIQRPYDPQTLNRYSYCRNNPLKYTDPTGYGWFKKFWKSIVSIVTPIVSIIAPPVAPAMMAINTAIGATTAIESGNPLSFVGAVVGGAVFGGVGKSLASSIASTMTKSFTNSFIGGAIIGSVEFGIAGFGAGLGAGLASGQSFPQALKSAGIGAGFGAATGAIIEGSYMAGWQNSMHGLSEGEIEAARASRIARKSVLGVYRSPNEVGLYNDNPVIYEATKWRFEGLGSALKSDYGILGCIATGEMFQGSEKIVVYGDLATKTPTSWQAATWTETGEMAPFTQWSLYNWKPVDEGVAQQLSVTKEAEAIFSIHSQRRLRE